MLNNRLVRIICYAVAMVCITAVTLSTKNTALMWWYLLPTLVFGIDINTNKKDKE